MRTDAPPRDSPTGEPLPAYSELPLEAGLPPGSSWRLWGREDRLGTLNLLTEERRRAAVDTVQLGRAIQLDIPFDLIDPPLLGRRAFEHVVTNPSVGHDEYLSGWYPQAGSQWDGFRHIRHPRFGFYNGLADDSHGVGLWADDGIVGRGVLVDVARYRADAGRPIDFGAVDAITPGDLTAAIAEQHVEIQVGDLLLIRTGWMTWYRGLAPAQRAALAEAGAAGMVSPGLQPGRDTAALLWDLHVAAVAADNPALETWPRAWPRSADEAAALLADPETCEEHFLHFSLLPLLGIPVGELWDLDELARQCRALDRHAFLLTAAPLNHRAGVGSTANAVAIL